MVPALLRLTGTVTGTGAGFGSSLTSMLDTLARLKVTSDPLSAVSFSAGVNSDGPSYIGSETKSQEAVSGIRAPRSKLDGRSPDSGSVIGEATCRSARWITQSPSFGDGYGLDSASGTATKNTRTPHRLPATMMAVCEIRSAALTARDARIPDPAVFVG